jgi:hypothetical protein
MKRSTAIVVSQPRVRNTVSTVTIARASPAKKRARRSRRNTRSSGPAASFAQSYANTLNDPFEYPGVPLGYDCYLPTQIIGAYKRGSITVNSTDGSFSIGYFPDITNLVVTYNGLSSALRSSSQIGLPAANKVNIQNNFTEARAISGGLRCFALFPETSASGVLFAGTAPDFSPGSMASFSTQALCDLPGSKMSVGYKGATILTRPYDNDAFAFTTYPIAGYNSIPVMTSGYIAGLGFPIGTVIWYEGIMNMEVLSGSIAGALGEPSDDIMSPSGASSFFPTPGQLLSAVSNMLSPSALLDGVNLAAGLMTGNSARSLNSASRLVSRFGSGRNVMNQSVQRRGREATIMIEEMKEESSGHGYVSL